MTAPDAPASPLAPDAPPAPGIRALDGNRAALSLLIAQNVISAVLIGLGVPLGTALLLSFAGNALLALTVFRPAMTALLRDPRWRTPPSWGLALAAFVLAFLASRAFVLAFVTLFPQGADAIPQFLSRGPDLWVLLLAAGLLMAFAVAHGVPASVVGVLPLSYTLARVTQHTGSLWNAVIVHALNNTLAVGLGAFLVGRNLGDTAQATELLSNPALAVPVAALALLFGGVVLTVLHLWLTPKPDPQVRAAPGPWLSAAFVGIVLFGAFAAASTFPAVQQALTSLRGALR
jgi:hypothetical protein